MSRGKQKSGGRKKPPPKKQTQKRAPPGKRSPPKMVIRNTAPSTALTVREPARPATGQVRNVRKQTSPPRLPMTTRVTEMGGSHVAAGIGGGVLGTALGVVVVGKQWLGPKLTAGILMGTGAAASAAGWYWDADHMMAVGTGLAAAGTVSMANQLSVAAYEAAEKKAAEKKAKREEEEKTRRLDEARELADEEAAKRPRNAPKILLVSRSDVDDDDQDEDSRAYAEDAA